MIEWLQLRKRVRSCCWRTTAVEDLSSPQRSRTGTSSLIHDSLTLCRNSHPGRCLEVARPYLVIVL